VVRGDNDAGAGRSTLLFRFALPRDLPPESSDTTADGAHRWMLSLDIDAPGISLHRRFDVPVARESTVPSAAIRQLPEASAHGTPAGIPPGMV
jgi:hypothetical protein